VQRKINKKFKFLFFKMDDIVVTNSLWQLERIWPKRVVFQSKVQPVSRWKIKCWTFRCLFWHVWLSLTSPFAAIVHTCWRYPLFTWNVFIILWKMYHNVSSSYWAIAHHIESKKNPVKMAVSVLSSYNSVNISRLLLVWSPGVVVVVVVGIYTTFVETLFKLTQSFAVVWSPGEIVTIWWWWWQRRRPKT
jgi:hypothetical protein